MQPVPSNHTLTPGIQNLYSHFNVCARAVWKKISNFVHNLFIFIYQACSRQRPSNPHFTQNQSNTPINGTAKIPGKQPEPAVAAPGGPGGPGGALNNSNSYRYATKRELDELSKRFERFERELSGYGSPSKDSYIGDLQEKLSSLGKTNNYYRWYTRAWIDSKRTLGTCIGDNIADVFIQLTRNGKRGYLAIPPRFEDVHCEVDPKSLRIFIDILNKAHIIVKKFNLDKTVTIPSLSLGDRELPVKIRKVICGIPAFADLTVEIDPMINPYGSRVLVICVFPNGEVSAKVAEPYKNTELYLHGKDGSELHCALRPDKDDTTLTEAGVANLDGMASPKEATSTYTLIQIPLQYYRSEEYEEAKEPEFEEGVAYRGGLFPQKPPTRELTHAVHADCVEGQSTGRPFDAGFKPGYAREIAPICVTYIVNYAAGEPEQLNALPVVQSIVGGLGRVALEHDVTAIVSSAFGVLKQFADNPNQRASERAAH